LDIAKPSSPSLAGQYDLPDVYREGLFYSGTEVYVADDSSEKAMLILRF
jgi:hypothetical protein